MGRRRRIALGLALLAAPVALAGGARVWWMEGGKYLFQPRKWGVVEADGLYRSGQIHRRLVEDALREHEIDLIVDLASGNPDGDPHEAAERAAAQRLGIRRLELSWRGDGRADADAYAAALAAVVRARRAGLRVLVHCNAGRERTGALVALYRVLEDGWDGARAWEEYLGYRKRPPRRPRLQRHLERVLPTVAEAMVREGLLASAPALPAFASSPAPGAVSAPASPQAPPPERR